MENQTPRVGVALILLKEDEVLLGKRKGFHGGGTWSFPGGKLEYYETAAHRALTELKEETGLGAFNIDLIDSYPCATTEDFFPELHYITLYLRAKYNSGTPHVKEKDKCEKWGWFSWYNLPDLPGPGGLFLPVKNLIKKGYNPFEIPKRK